MKKHDNLCQAKRNKNDEFYTRMEDIEKELEHYQKHFENKIIYCNCDNPTFSNFYKYFQNNMKRFKIKKLITTHYSPEEPVYKTEILNENPNKPGNLFDSIGLPENNFYNSLKIFKTKLKGNGDFRSDECVEALKEADIVVTNAPFSLFREYVELLFKHEKKFLIIGNKNVIVNKDFFPLFKNNQVWLGYNTPNDFFTPDGLITKKVNGLTRWFTNLSIPKNNEELPLTKKYNPQDYPKYDNYEAINVDKTKDIPCDYYGVMGVPITFLDKYNPNQFEIIWEASGNSYRNMPKELLEELKFNPNIKHNGGLGPGIVNGRVCYSRILIRRKIVNQGEKNNGEE